MPAWTPAPYALPYIAANDVLEQTPATNKAQMEKISEYLAQVARMTPLGTIIPWALPYDEDGGGPYSNVHRFAPFHLPCTGGVYETSVAPNLAAAIGHTFAPYTGAGWVTVDAAGKGYGPNEPGCEIVAFWQESDLQAVFRNEPDYNTGAALPWANKFALCFYADYPFGGWANARVAEYRYESNTWGWHFYSGDGDMTRVLNHEIVGGEHLPLVFNPSGDRYPMQAWSGSAWEDVSEDGVYEFDWEGPDTGDARRWDVVTHDGFVTPDFRGRSPIGTGGDGVARDWALGERFGDKLTNYHRHDVRLTHYSAVRIMWSGTGTGTAGKTYTGPAYDNYDSGADYWTAFPFDDEDGDNRAMGFGLNYQPSTSVNFLIFAGEKILDPAPLNDTRTRNGDVHRLHAVTTDKMLFQRLADPNLSDEGREMLTAQLNGEPWPPPVDS